MTETLKHDDEIKRLKIPPHSVEAEIAVLGGLMLDNNAWDQVADCLSEADFYQLPHRLIFQAIAELVRASSPFDVLTISEKLKESGELAKVGGDSFLFQLAQNTPTASNILAYAKIVRERSIKRQLLEAVHKITHSAFDKGSSAELLDLAERSIFSIAEQSNRGEGPVAISDLLATAVDHMEALQKNGGEVSGVSTGFIDLDKKTSGLQPGSLVIVAGRPSMGKTCLMLNIAEGVLMSCDKPVLIFSMEMPGESIAMRSMSSLGGVEQQKVRSGQLNDADWTRIMSYISGLADKKLFVDDTPAMSPGEVRARARRLARQHGGLGLIVVDYLQLMQVPGKSENRTLEISEISRSLKALAKELSVPVIAGSQLNRGLEQRQDKRPMMSDLRESGAIEQDADLIMFIYRDEVYNPETEDKGMAEIIIGKQRNGPTGMVRMTFQGQYTKFENYTSDGFASSD